VVAIDFLAFSIKAFTDLPNEWVDDGLPNCSLRDSEMVVTTSGRSAVVAALSK
jgi:hypothetical protein